MTASFYKNGDLDRLAREFAAIAVRAGAAILEVYRGAIDARLKADQSPVTLADERAEAVILPALATLAPGVEVVSEESFRPSAVRGRGESATLILVDPLDGTREFLSRNGEFTVNIGLVEGGRPVAGCVYAPASGALYFAGNRAYAQHLGSERAAAAIADAPEAAELSGAQPIAVRITPKSDAIALVSRSHRDAKTEAWLAAAGPLKLDSVGSAVKFCRIAEGRADLYPRFGTTMEWDTAAGHAVLAAAGGSVAAPDGTPFVYGKFDAGLRNGPFIARGRSS